METKEPITKENIYSKLDWLKTIIIDNEFDQYELNAIYKWSKKLIETIEVHLVNR